MTNDDFKKLLGEVIKPLQEGIEELRKGQERFSKELSSFREELAGFREELAGFREELAGFREELDGAKEDQADLRRLIEERVLPPLVYIETTVKSYADQYVTNKDHIGRLDKRLNIVEDNLGIQPPQELTLP